MTKKSASMVKVKVQMGVEDWEDFLADEANNFNEWRDMVIETIKTQKLNLYRADYYVSMFAQVATNDLARLVAHAQNNDTLLWAFNFSKKVVEHVDITLGKLQDIFATFTYEQVIQDGLQEAQDPIVKMVPYFTDKCTLDEVYWGDVTYQTIRPYGEKLSDAIRGAFTRLEGIKEKLDDEALKLYKEFVGESEE